MTLVSTLANAATSVGRICARLVPLLEDGAVDALLRSLGLLPPPGLLATPTVASAITALREAADTVDGARIALQQANGENDDAATALAAAALLGAIAATGSSLAAATSALDAASATLPGLTTTQRTELHDFALAFVPMLRDRMLTDEWRERSPHVSSALLVTGLVEIVDYDDGGPGSLRIASTQRRLRLDRVSKLLRDLGGHVRDVYGWGAPTFDGVTLFRVLQAVLTDNSLASNLLAPSGLPPSLEAFIFRVALDPSSVPPGLELSLRFPANISNTATPTADDWQFPVQATLQFDTDLELKLQPPFSLGVLSSAGTARAAITAEGLRLATAGPFVILGDEGALRLEATGLRFGITLDSGELDVASSKSTALQLSGSIGGGKVVISGQGDSFVARLLGGHDVAATFDMNTSWDPVGGLLLEGNPTLEIDISVQSSVGPILVDSLHIGFVVGPDLGSIEVSASVAAALGPFVIELDRIGIQASLDGSKTSGNLGIVQLDVGWQPPRGAGISVDVGPVEGAGSVVFDPNTGTYEGSLALDVLGLGLSAVGLVTTKPSFSFAMIVAAQTPGIPLGLGFTLDGVGGVIAIDRGADTDALRAAIRAGGTDDIFFPNNPVAQAGRLLGDLARFFPATLGRYLFGPSAKIGWGTPRVFSGVVALLLEVPAPVRMVLLAQLQLGLPELGDAIVDIRIDAVGDLDFDRKTFALDASLHDSKIAGYPLAGDMALRLAWGDAPQFLFSIGGFHPHFTPPPGFPTLRRLSLTAGDNPQLRMSCYLALTSNTAQVGAQVDLTASGGGFDIKAHVGFDALFEFGPLHFEVEITASASISWHGYNLLGVDLDFLLTGPHPWHAKGDASFGILWWSVSVGFDVTWGDATPAPLPPPPDIAGALRDAFGRADAWSGVLSAGELAWVAFGSAAADTTTVHPFAALVVREHVVPLDYDITEFGNIPLAASQRFAIASTVQVGTTAATTTIVSDEFAPGQFTQLTSDQKLAAPSFEAFHSGVLINSGVIPGRDARAPMDTETIVDDPFAPPTPTLSPVALPSAFASLASAVRPTGRPPVPPRGGPRFSDLAYTLASTDDLAITAQSAAIGRGSTTYAGLREALRIGAPQASASLQVVPRVQVANANARVVVVSEDDHTRNLDFVDTVTGRAMTRAEFVDAINAGTYPDYLVRNINGVPTPVSRPNATTADNLG